MTAALVLVFGLAFVAAQGAAIFVTAFAALEILGVSHRVARAPAMIISYAGWVGVTIVGYMALGGEGGLMDGFGMVLALCFTALVSTVIYLMIWHSASLFNQEVGNG